jgi:DNA adenine methylase
MTSHEISPLRYPGGKGALAPFLGRLIAGQAKPAATYVEPFAGGAGAALRLLYDEYVDRIVLNDLDAGVAAFWRSVFHRTHELATRIEGAEVTVDAWHEHRAVYQARATITDDVGLGFSTFFLNRTNRSGILSARPIGGLKQTGPWRIDARFNRASLAWRIRELGHYRNRVTVLQEDGLDVIEAHGGAKHFIYADPPYLDRGSDLYLNTLTWADHERLARMLTSSRARWMVTYNHDDRVHHLYPRQRRAAFSIAHTAAHPHVGRELAVFSSLLEVSDLGRLGRNAAFVG